MLPSDPKRSDPIESGNQPDGRGPSRRRKPAAQATEDRPKARGERGGRKKAARTEESEIASELARDEPIPEAHRGLLAEDRIDPDAVKVIRRLVRAGHKAYLVGGGVRDLLLDQRPKDFDVATSARPNEVRKLFRNCRVIGRRFRLAHILFAGGKIIEVATFRRDPSDRDEAESELTPLRNGRTRSIAPPLKERGDDVDLLIRHDNVFGLPHEDAIRRDFTINGLFYDLVRHEVIDYVGGVPDVTARVVRTIGEPDIRFREDPVRILRAVKFSARLGLGIAPEVYDAMVDQREALRRSAAPRVLEEILRLLRGGAARRSIYLAWDVGVLGVVLPELAAHLEDEATGAHGLWHRLDAIDELFAQDRLPRDTVLFTALLYGPFMEALEHDPDPTKLFDEFFEDLVSRLVLPRRTRDRVRLVLAAQRRLDRGKWSALKRRDFFADALALYEIRARSENRELPKEIAALIQGKG